MIAPSVSLVPVGGSSRAIRTAGGVLGSNYLVLLSILGVGHPVRCSERMTVGPLRAVAPCRPEVSSRPGGTLVTQAQPQRQPLLTHPQV